MGACRSNVGGLILIVFGLVLIGLELTVTSHGLLGFGGILCIALGAAALYTEPGDPFAPVLRVAPAVIITVTITASLFIGLIAAGRRPDPPDGRARAGSSAPAVASGTHGVVRSPLAPLGSAYIGGEEWTARSADDRPIDRGTPVTVVAVDGLTVLVEPDPPPVGRLATGGPMDVIILAITVAIIVVILLTILYLSVRVVQQYEKMVVFRLGRTNENLVREPGLRFLIPIVDRPVKVNIREQFIEVPSQTTITKDNAPINVDFLIYWRISEPLKSVVNVANFPGALQGVATTTLRAVIGDILLDEVLSRREQINEVLRVKLDEVTERWGGKVTTVEIREITPPRDVQDAMNRQLSAERTRRAVITESEGNRQAAINNAEGQKQSEILKAEGERQAAILRAEGFSQALTRIFDAASGVDEKTMALQYLEALKALGASPSTKFVIPAEVTRWIEPLAGYIEKGIAKPAG